MMIFGSRNSSASTLHIDHESGAQLLSWMIASAGNATEDQQPSVDKLIKLLADLTTLASPKK